MWRIFGIVGSHSEGEEGVVAIQSDGWNRKDESEVGEALGHWDQKRMLN